jgi:hypothetical protein
MTLYPRRDVVHVAVSPQQGGCGASHTRTVTRGAPDLDWTLDCPPCEAVLSGHPQWAKTRAEIPETPDETIKRESLKNQKDRNLEEIQTAAMAQMAWGNQGIPSELGFGAKSAVCRNGHGNPATSRFCAQCGTSMNADTLPGADSSTSEAVAEDPDYNKMTVSELRRIAGERGIDPSQGKKDLVTALS